VNENGVQITTAQGTSQGVFIDKIYSAILQQKPDAKWKPLDELLKKQREGKLDDSLRKKCG